MAFDQALPRRPFVSFLPEFQKSVEHFWNKRAQFAEFRIPDSEGYPTELEALGDAVEFLGRALQKHGGFAAAAEWTRYCVAKIR